MARPGKFVAFQGKNDKELLARWKKSNFIKITQADIKCDIVYYYLLLQLQTQFCWFLPWTRNNWKVYLAIYYAKHWMRSPSAKHPALALTYSPEHIKFVYSVVMLKSPQRGEDKTKRFYAMSGSILSRQYLHVFVNHPRSYVFPKPIWSARALSQATITGWFSNRTRTLVDDFTRKSNNWIDQWNYTNEAESAGEILIWLESVTEKETGNA